jgi:hypothetical protein
MNHGHLVFSQITDIFHRELFQRCVAKHPMPRSSRGFSARDQLLTMVFAQLTYRSSLRDVEACLSGNPNLYAMGIRGDPTRTNIAYANKHRSWKVYEDFAQLLIKKVRPLYLNDSSPVGLDEMVYAFDSSTIDLCLSLFPWAKFRKTKSAVKLHTMIDLRGSIPVFISITDGKVHDVNALDQLVVEPGSIYALDRGYVDFCRLYRLHSDGGFFVTRAKKNMVFRVCRSTIVDKFTGLNCDQTIRLKSVKARESYPEILRRVSYTDASTGKRLVFLTNNFYLPAIKIAEVYKGRWQIELFFKWIKQNLRIKTFFGNSENAVKTQIWIAISTYLMVASLNKQLKLDLSMSKMLQILSVNPFQKVALYQLLTEHSTTSYEDIEHNQLLFNDF